MGAGFLFWVVAARTVSVTDVGIAASTSSGVMLCTQLALMGTSSAVIVQIGRGRNPDSVLDTAFTLVMTSSLVIGTLFLFLSLQPGYAVGGAAAIAGYGLLVVAATVFGTISICLDQASIALRRPGSAVLRYSVGGAASFLAILGWSLFHHGRGAHLGATAIFACWTLTACAACVLGAVQLRHWSGYRYRPTVSARDSSRMLGIGLPNQLLTLTERAPQLLLPVLLAHLVAPEVAAYWYPAWMMAWIVYTAPVSVGLVQFADTVRDPSAARRTTWSGLRWSLLLGGVLALALVGTSRPLLALMGAAYAAASTHAMQVLAIGLVPYAVLQAYNALCRARQRLVEGITFGVLVGALAVSTSLAVANRGVTAMAIAWVASMSCGAIWALIRLRQLSCSPQPVLTRAEAEIG